MRQGAPGTDGYVDVDELYRRHGSLVKRRIRRFYGSEEAEDVLQEVFLRAIDKIGTFRGESSPVTWLYQLTTRHCLNRRRDEGRRRELWAQRRALLPGSSDGAQEAVTTLGQVERALDEDIVRIGACYHLGGMSHAEIAELVGCSRRTIGNRLQDLEQAGRRLAGAR